MFDMTNIKGNQSRGQPKSRATEVEGNRSRGQPKSRATEVEGNRSRGQPKSRATEVEGNRSRGQPKSRATEVEGNRSRGQPKSRATWMLSFYYPRVGEGTTPHFFLGVKLVPICQPQGMTHWDDTFITQTGVRTTTYLT